MRSCLGFMSRWTTNGLEVEGDEREKLYAAASGRDLCRTVTVER